MGNSEEGRASVKNGSRNPPRGQGKRIKDPWEASTT